MIWKAEQANPNDGVDAGPMVPRTWFPIFAKFANTKYYKEVLRDCGRFSGWVRTK